jgi:hypothetical protein
VEPPAIEAAPGHVVACHHVASIPAVSPLAPQR